MRRIGALTAWAADDPAAQVRIAAFLQGLAHVDRNVHIDIRWARTDTDDLRKQAAELTALAPARESQNESAGC